MATAIAGGAPSVNVLVLPVEKMLEGEKEKLLRMEENLARRVIGQPEAVKVVSTAVRRARAGLSLKIGGIRNWNLALFSAPQNCASQRMLTVSGPLTLSGLDGTVQCPSARNTMVLASPCQTTLTWPVARLMVTPALEEV